MAVQFLRNIEVQRGKKSWFRQRNLAKVGTLISICPASRASSVGGTDSESRQKEPGPFKIVLLSNTSCHLWGDNIELGSHVLGSLAPSPVLPAPWGPKWKVRAGFTQDLSQLALLAHCFSFWKQVFLFHLEPLILHWPHQSFLVFILIIRFCSTVSTKLCSHQ